MLILRKSKIGRELVRRIFFLASIFALMASMLDLSVDFNRHRDQIDQSVEQMTGKLSASLADLLWYTNRTLIDSLLFSIVSLPQIDGVSLSGEFLDDDFSHGLAISADCDNVLQVPVTVINRYTDKVFTVETLQVCVSHRSAWDNLLGRLFSTFLIDTVKTIVMAFVVLLAAQQIIAVPLGALRNQLKQQWQIDAGAMSESGNEITDLGELIESSANTIKSQRNFSETTLMAMAEGVVVTDFDFKIIRSNIAAVKLLSPAIASPSDIRGEVLLDSDQLGAAAAAKLKQLKREMLSQGDGVTRSPTLPLKNGRAARFSLSISTADESEHQRLVFVIADLTESFNLNKELDHLANHDALTGIANRRAFQSTLESTVKALKNSDDRHCLLLMDIDNFKWINDSLGHVAGDSALKQIALRLESNFNSIGRVARIGGDEFAVILYDLDFNEGLERAEVARARISKVPIEFDNHLINISLRIGLRELNAHTVSADDALAEADVANIMARDNGGGSVAVYEKMLQHGAAFRNLLFWRDQLREAFRDDRVRIYAQPIVHSSSLELDSIEILARIVLANGEIVMPFHFVAAAERFGHIIELDLMMLRKTLGIAPHFDENLNFNINLSGETVSSPQAIAEISTEIARWDGDASRLCFEITETSAVRNLSRASEHLQALRALGCKVALDDFGSGLSSLQHLRELPIDILKIDGAFIQDITQSVTDVHLVEAMVSIAQAIGIKVVAEFVGSKQACDLLDRAGVHCLQGNFIAKAQPVENWFQTITVDSF